MTDPSPPTELIDPPEPPAPGTPGRPRVTPPIAAGLITAVVLLLAVLVLANRGGEDPPSDSGTTAPTAAPTTTAPPETLAPHGPVIFAEEFDAAELNRAVWTPYFNSYGDGNNELACLTPANVEVADGTLRLTARRETISCPTGGTRRFTSGFISTRETGVYFPRYGRFEIRARLPHGQGLWPAFWLRHRNGAKVGEVDVLEYFHVQKPGQGTATLHWNGNRSVATGHVAFEAPTAEPGWNTWAVEIDSVDEGTRFRWSLNDVVYLSHVELDSSPLPADPTEPLWDMAVNLAVGGDWAGNPDGTLGCLDAVNRCFNADAVRPAEFPATYEVDWVRVYEPAPR